MFVTKVIIKNIHERIVSYGKSLVHSLLGINFNVMRSINLCFTYLLNDSTYINFSERIEKKKQNILCDYWLLKPHSRRDKIGVVQEKQRIADAQYN